MHQHQRGRGAHILRSLSSSLSDDNPDGGDDDADGRGFENVRQQRQQQQQHAVAVEVVVPHSNVIDIASKRQRRHTELRDLPDEGFVVVGATDMIAPSMPTAGVAPQRQAASAANALPRWVPRETGTTDGEETFVAAGQGMRAGASSMLHQHRPNDSEASEETDAASTAVSWLQRDWFALTYTSPATEREFLYRLYEGRTQGLLSLFAISTVCAAVLIFAYDTEYDPELQHQLAANSAVSAFFGCCLFVWMRTARAANIQSAAAATAATQQTNPRAVYHQQAAFNGDGCAATNGHCRHQHDDGCLGQGANPLATTTIGPMDAGHSAPQKEGCSGRALFPTATAAMARTAATRWNGAAIAFILNQARDLKHAFVRVFELFCIVLGAIFASFCNAQLAEMAACELALTDASHYRSTNPCTAFVPTVGTVCQMALVFILAPRALITIPLMLLCTSLIYAAKLQIDYELYTTASFGLVATVLSCISVYLLLMAVLQDRAARVVFEDSVRLDLAVHHTLQVRRELDEILEAVFPQKLVLERIIARKAVVDSGDAVAVGMFEIRDFLKWSTTMLPADTINTIGFLYSIYDRSAEELGIPFVKALGDRYLACCGLTSNGVVAEEGRGPPSPSPSKRDGHATTAAEYGDSCVTRMLRFGLRQQQTIADVNQRVHNVLEPLVAVVAVHVGPALGVMLGSKHVMSYELIGPAVVTARQLVSVVPEAQVTASIDAVRSLIGVAPTPSLFSVGTAMTFRGEFTISPLPSPVDLLLNGSCVSHLDVATIQSAAMTANGKEYRSAREVEALGPAGIAHDDDVADTFELRNECDLELLHPSHLIDGPSGRLAVPSSSLARPFVSPPVAASTAWVAVAAGKGKPPSRPNSNDDSATTFSATVEFANRIQRLRYLAIVAMVRSRHHLRHHHQKDASDKNNKNDTAPSAHPTNPVPKRSFSLTLSKRTPLVPPELLGLSSDMFVSGSIALCTSADNNSTTVGGQHEHPHPQQHRCAADGQQQPPPPPSLLGSSVTVLPRWPPPTPPADASNHYARRSRAAVELAKALALDASHPIVNATSESAVCAGDHVPAAFRTGGADGIAADGGDGGHERVDDPPATTPAIDEHEGDDDVFGREAFALFLRELRPDVAVALERDGGGAGDGDGLHTYMALVEIMRRGTVDNSSTDGSSLLVVVKYLRTLYRTLIRRVVVPFESATIVSAFRQFHILRSKPSKRIAYVVHGCFMTVLLAVVAMDVLLVSQRLPDNSLAPMAATQSEVLLSSGFFLIIAAIVLSWVRFAIGVIPCGCGAPATVESVAAFAAAGGQTTPDVSTSTLRIVYETVISAVGSGTPGVSRGDGGGEGVETRCIGFSLWYSADVLYLLGIFALGHLGMVLLPRGVINNSHVFLFQHHVVMAFLVTTNYVHMVVVVFVDAVVFLLSHLLIQTDDGKGRWMLVYFYIFAGVLMAWVRELRYIYRFDLLCLHRALLDATQEELSLQRHLFSVLLPPCLRDRQTIAQLAAHRRTVAERSSGCDVPLLPPIRLHHSDICTLAIRLDPFLFSGSFPPAMFVLRLDAILSAIECAVYEANELVSDGGALRRHIATEGRGRGAIVSTKETTSRRSSSSTSCSDEDDEDRQLDEVLSGENPKEDPRRRPNNDGLSATSVPSQLQTSLSRISLAGDYVLFAGPLPGHKSSTKPSTRRNGNAAAAAAPTTNLSSASDIALAKSAKAILLVCASMMQAAEADAASTAAPWRGVASPPSSLHRASLGNRGERPNPLQGNTTSNPTPQRGEGSRQQQQQQQRPVSTLQLTSIACLGSGFVTILGSRGLTPTLLGAVARQSSALLLAAPTGFHGCSEQFSQFLSHVGVDPSGDGGDDGSVALLPELKWRVRGSGTMMVRPFGLA